MMLKQISASIQLVQHHTAHIEIITSTGKRSLWLKPNKHWRLPSAQMLLNYRLCAQHEKCISLKSDFFKAFKSISNWFGALWKAQRHYTWRIGRASNVVGSNYFKVEAKRLVRIYNAWNPFNRLTLFRRPNTILERFKLGSTKNKYFNIFNHGSCCGLTRRARCERWRLRPIWRYRDRHCWRLYCRLAVSQARVFFGVRTSSGDYLCGYRRRFIAARDKTDPARVRFVKSSELS